MNERTEHLIRTGLILVLTLAVAAAWLWAPLDPEMRARLEGLMVLLGPALLDSLNVARRQRPGTGGASSVLLVLVVLLCAGCGATARADAARSLHEGLNLVTDAVDPSYELAVESCDARAAVIVAREGTTAAQDAEAMAQVRERCEIVFARFEEIRTAQAAARGAASAFESGDLDFAAALAAVSEVRRLWGLVQAAIERHRDPHADGGGES